MNPHFLFELGWKSAVVAGLALAALRLMRSRSAAEKSLAAHLGLLALLLLPFAVLTLPRIEVAAPAALAMSYEAAAPASSADDTAAPPAAEPGVATTAGAESFGWSEITTLTYAVPALLLLLLTLAAVLRLQRLRARAEVLIDPQWLTALASAQKRLRLKHGTALLMSHELKSPISWGVVRPIIIIDSHAARQVDRAEAIIAHELAHVARMDWLALLLGRAATAIYWFNPLVWMLARHAHDLSEQAADDVVLRSNVPGTDYAEILVNAARHACAPLMLAANGVAPGRGSLGRRVASILDPTRSRIPARFGWSSVCMAGALGIGSAVAAVGPQPAVEPTAQPGASGRIAAARSAASPALAEALIEAAERGDLAAMAELIEAGASPDSVLDGDGTPLIAAARAGRADAVSLLLARGADVNLGVRGDGNPLIAAAGGGRTDVVRLLLDHGADIEAAVPEDENALITASRRGRVEVVRLLVARGADVNRNVDGRTPLGMARTGGHTAIATLLTEAGAMR